MGRGMAGKPATPARRRVQASKKGKRYSIPFPKLTLQVSDGHLSAAEVRRLARRGGVKRLNVGIYPEIERALRIFLENVLRDTAHHCPCEKENSVPERYCVCAKAQRGSLVSVNDMKCRYL
jgi:histone H3/H4